MDGDKYDVVASSPLNKNRSLRDGRRDDVNEVAFTSLWESSPPRDRVISERMEEEEWVFVVRVVAVDLVGVVSETTEHDLVSPLDDDAAVAV